MNRNDSADADRAQQEPDRRPYETPVLTVHGTVGHITRFIGPASGDGIIGSQIIISDRAVKQDFAPVDSQEILARLVSMPVERWSYRFQDPSVRHIGPMAQDFAAAFGLGSDDRRIDVVDANGVTIAAIQALYAQLQARDERIDELRREVELLKQRTVS
jgi:hypothetical protein